MGGKLTREYNEIPSHSSEVCEADINDVVTFRVSYTTNGQKRVLSGICTIKKYV